MISLPDNAIEKSFMHLSVGFELPMQHHAKPWRQHSRPGLTSHVQRRIYPAKVGHEINVYYILRENFPHDRYLSCDHNSFGPAFICSLEGTHSISELLGM